MKKENKTGKGLVVTLVVLIILLVGIIVFGGYKYINLQKNNDKLTDENKTITEKLNKQKEKYITFKKEYKIYALEQHHSATYSIVVGYNDSLYHITAGEYGIMCISKIKDAKFDSNGNYTCKPFEDSDESYIHKFNGKESDLSKVAFSVSYNSTDGAKYPILIYKSGNIESLSDETNSVLKNYKIKDFISEKCNKFESNAPACEKGQILYKVILQDGTEKTIVK